MTPATESDLESAGAGFVVLDIGGDIGAAIVYVDESLAGHELEIRRRSEAWAGQHTGIWRRPTGDTSTVAAVFPSLPADDYEVRVMSDATAGVVTPVTVIGGSVTSLSHPTE